MMMHTELQNSSPAPSSLVGQKSFMANLAISTHLVRRTVWIWLPDAHSIYHSRDLTVGLTPKSKLSGQDDYFKSPNLAGSREKQEAAYGERITPCGGQVLAKWCATVPLPARRLKA
jgi:hypothetical protein